MRFVNKDIIEILKQCRVAIIPDNIEDIPRIIIPKTEQVEFEVNNCYSISINQDKLVDFDVDFPNNIFNLDIELIDINDRFIKVFSPLWEGWLPKTCIQITKKL